MSENITQQRQFVSRLIYLVLTDCLCVREALLKFPKDTNDKSIKAAYHALIHRDSDEELRYLDINYKDEQDEYLEFIAQVLQKGDELPSNFIKNYEKYYKYIDTPHSNTIKGFLKTVCKFLNVN